MCISHQIHYNVVYWKANKRSIYLSIYLFQRLHTSEPETIKIFPDCNRTINDCNSTVKVLDGPVTVYTNFYSFGLWNIERFSRKMAKKNLVHLAFQGLLTMRRILVCVWVNLVGWTLLGWQWLCQGVFQAGDFHANGTIGWISSWFCKISSAKLNIFWHFLHIQLNNTPLEHYPILASFQSSGH